MELFEHSSPLLEERLGKKAFDSIPSCPGVYRFFDDQDTIIYVGKSKNLRKRLFQYKRARPGRVTKKTARLIRLIQRFEVEPTDSETEALLLENRLIRLHRPHFNHANKHTETYYYIRCEPSPEAIHFGLTMNLDQTGEPTERWYGAFKGHGPVRQSLGSLIRLLWMYENNCFEPGTLPVQLTRKVAPMSYRLDFVPGSRLTAMNTDDLLHDWLSGESNRLLVQLASAVETVRCEGGFRSVYLKDQLDRLERFHHSRLRHYAPIRKRYLTEERTIIYQNELDDLWVQWFHDRESQPEQIGIHGPNSM